MNSDRSAQSPQPTGSTASLVDLVPGFDRWLDDEARRLVSRFQVPVLSAFDGPFDLPGTLRSTRAFAVIIAGGMVVRTVSLGEHAALQLLGPGDLINRSGEYGSDLVSPAGLQARGLVRYAVLDDRVLALIQPFPRLVEGLQALSDGQQQRLLAQLLICQLPRVEDRVLALMWLLAETWGRTTTSGTVVSVRLTHDTIGLLIGARRPTVTLALRALEERGALVRRADDWLILERPQPHSAPAGTPAGLPYPAAPRAKSTWDAPAITSGAATAREAMRSLMGRQAETIEHSRTIVAMADATSQRSAILLERITVRRSRRDGLHHQDDPADLPVAPSGSER